MRMLRVCGFVDVRMCVHMIVSVYEHVGGVGGCMVCVCVECAGVRFASSQGTLRTSLPTLQSL